MPWHNFQVSVVCYGMLRDSLSTSKNLVVRLKYRQGWEFNVLKLFIFTKFLNCTPLWDWAYWNTSKWNQKLLLGKPSWNRISFRGFIIFLIFYKGWLKKKSTQKNDNYFFYKRNGIIQTNGFFRRIANYTWPCSKG